MNKLSISLGLVILVLAGCATDEGYYDDRANQPWAKPAQWENDRTLTPADLTYDSTKDK